MSQQEYITQNADVDIKWYSDKAGRYRALHLLSKVFIIVTSAAITVLSNIEFKSKGVLIAVLSALIVIITSIAELMKFKEQWLEYRSTAETLKVEKTFFETGTGPYDKEDNFKLFVKNFEAIKQQENQRWRGYISEKQ